MQKGTQIIIRRGNKSEFECLESKEGSGSCLTFDEATDLIKHIEYLLSYDMPTGNTRLEQNEAGCEITRKTYLIGTGGRNKKSPIMDTDELIASLLLKAIANVDQFRIFIDSIIPPDKGTGLRQALNELRVVSDMCENYYHIKRQTAVLDDLTQQLRDMNIQVRK